MTLCVAVALSLCVVCLQPYKVTVQCTNGKRSVVERKYQDFQQLYEKVPPPYVLRKVRDVYTQYDTYVT